MPQIVNASTVEFPFLTSQEDVKNFARDLFSENFSDIERLLVAFDNAEIKTRNFSVPLTFFINDGTFENRNKKYIDEALEHSVKAIEDCLKKSGFEKSEITDLIFVSTTGISTPSLDAKIINEMKLSQNINRLPIWGLGCAGGVAGIEKANIIAKANPDAVVILIAAELCSLTFIKNDLSKSNLIATGLFSDGIAAILITGDKIGSKNESRHKIKIHSSQSKIYYDTLDVMGWEILDDGFKVVFSRDIPTIVNENVRNDILDYLNRHSLQLLDIKNFITHPGGAKVIKAYESALQLDESRLKNTKMVLEKYGNMSSATVLYVLKEFMDNGFENGYGLMTALGPGFSNEMALLEIEN